MFKPFDIVKANFEKEDFAWDSPIPEKQTYYGMVVTTQGDTASVEWFDDSNRPIKNAWWDNDELTVIGNFLAIIANNMDCHYHHGGNKSSSQGSMFFTEKGLEMAEEYNRRLEAENRSIYKKLAEARATINKQAEAIKKLSE